MCAGIKAALNTPEQQKKNPETTRGRKTRQLAGGSGSGSVCGEGENKTKQYRSNCNYSLPSFAFVSVRN